MTPSGDKERGMSRSPLDLDTIDRLLRGRVLPDDAPPGCAEVARLVEAVTADASSRELARIDETVAAMTDALGSKPSLQRATTNRTSVLLKMRIAALVVGVLTLSSTSLAVAGALPAPIQDAASAVLGTVGVSTPPRSEPAQLVGPTAGWLCMVQRWAYGDTFNVAPSQELSKANQVAGQTLKDFCDG
jgi:hypothetical protein